MGTQSQPKGEQQPPTFRPMSIMAKRSPISGTAELASVINLTRPSKVYNNKLPSLSATHRGASCGLSATVETCNAGLEASRNFGTQHRTTL